MTPERTTSRNKFGARSVETADGRFDSKGELRRWHDLKLLERGGVITNLKRQVPFPLVVNGTKVCDYRADFTYRDVDGHEVVEDFKGVVTKEFRIKARLFEAIHGRPILITRARL